MTTKLRAKKNIYFFVLSFLFVLLFSGIVSADVMEHNYATGMPVVYGPAYDNMAPYYRNYTYMAQTFTVGTNSLTTDYTLDTVVLQLKNYGAQTLSLGIYETNATGYPLGSPISIVGINSNQLSGDWKNVTIRFNPHTLKVGHKYVLVLKVFSWYSNESYISIQGSSGENYSGGNELASTSPIADCNPTLFESDTCYSLSPWTGIELGDNYDWFFVINANELDPFLAVERVLLKPGQNYTFNWTQEYAFLGSMLDDYSFQWAWLSDNAGCTQWGKAGQWIQVQYPDDLSALTFDCGWGYDFSTGEDTIVLRAGYFLSSFTLKTYGCVSDTSVAYGEHWFCQEKNIIFGVNTETVPTTDVGTSISKVSDGFAGLFPDAQYMTGKQRVAYILISALAIAILVIFGSLIFFKGFPPAMGYLLLFLEFLLFVFFLTISYIPVVVLVVFVLVLLALVVFKMKGGG